MRQRLLGLELELFLTKAGVPLRPGEWKNIVERAVARGCPLIDEPYTGFPLGAICERGRFVLDNNCSVVEMVTLPHPTLEETISNLRELIGFFREIAPEVELNWTSQFAEPNEEEYWRRTIPGGLYGSIRKEKWQHWTMMNSMAFQPAIDLHADEVTHVLRVLYLTAPVFICAFEGNKRWGRAHSPRLEAWREMIPGGEGRIGIPKLEIASLADYVENLLRLPAFILSEGYKSDRLTYFGSPPKAPSVAEVMFGKAKGMRICGIMDHSDARKAEVIVEEVLVRGALSDFYGLSLPFWHARLVFETDGKGCADDAGDIVKAIETAPKRYVEIRHIGTPRNIVELERYYGSFLKLVDNAEALDAEISAVIRWHEAAEDNLTAIRQGTLGGKSRNVLSVLQKFGVLP